MRKRYRVLLLAAIAAAFVVPVGFALSLESPAPRVARATPAVVAHAAPAAVDSSSSDASLQLPDGAKLLVVGTALFGLAAAVRRAA